jgi:hypothetical protein
MEMEKWRRIKMRGPSNIRDLILVSHDAFLENSLNKLDEFSNQLIWFVISKRNKKQEYKSEEDGLGSGRGRCGYGRGNGSWRGDVDGYGSGSGSRNGYGDGDGYGGGSGNGYGSGSGYGFGDGEMEE